MELTFVLAIFGAITGTASTFVAAYIALRKLPAERKKAEAETAVMITKAAGTLIDDWQNQVERLKTQLETYKAAIKVLQDHDLEKQHKIDDMENQQDDMKKDLSLAQSRIRELTAQNKALQQENKELRAFYEKQAE